MNKKSSKRKRKKVKRYIRKSTLALIVVIAAFISFEKINDVLYSMNDDIPTYNLKSIKKTVVVDAGHGGYDVGSMSEYNDLEKDITLEIALKVGSFLEAAGINVVYPRDGDQVSWPEENLLDLKKRVAIAKEAKADYYISIHLNASSFNDGAQGYELYTDGKNQAMQTMARNLSKNLDSLGYLTSRGIKSTEGNSLYVIDKNPIPAILIELGFITDRDDLAVLKNTYSQKQLAKSIADSILLL